MSTTVDRSQLLDPAELFGALQDPALNSMNFLNEVAHRYPQAVSLAAGRPFEEFFELGSIDRYLKRFCQYLQDDLGYTDEQVHRTLFQYGRTKGIVHGLVAANLLRDEGIPVDPEAVVVTVGCQEAMYLVLRALRQSPADLLLTVAPTYVGLTGAARLVDLPVWPVAGGPNGVDLADLARQLRLARDAGRRPRACYLMPDFANPSGLRMSLDSRRALLELAADEGLLLLEDNPYGLFGHDEGSRVPTLKALDEHRSVIYLGSFAKTAMPGARVGYVIADQLVAPASATAPLVAGRDVIADQLVAAASATAPLVAGRDVIADQLVAAATPTGVPTLLADELSKIKSMLTVNTSPITQAIVGGKLLDNDCSLVLANERERAVYARNMRHIVRGLAARFPDPISGVSYTVPAGGFFVVVTVPFPVDDAMLEHSAADYGVLWTPMHHFYEAGAAVNSLRLSCSSVTSEQIETGLDRLARLISDQLRTLV